MRRMEFKMERSGLTQIGERLKVIETIKDDANKSLEELKTLATDESLKEPTTDEVLKGLN